MKWEQTCSALRRGFESRMLNKIKGFIKISFACDDEILAH